MKPKGELTGVQPVLLWATLLIYISGRLSQLYADRLPALLVVLLHVMPPATFALLHGRTLYRWKGIIFFSTLCLAVGGAAETLSLRTGFPFGHYSFTEVMGPKLYDLPFLLVLAYLGMGYCSWCLSLIILGNRQPQIRGIRVLTIPLLGSLIMLAWDISMEADWSTVDRAWIWHEGGAYFGVPLSNFAGWYLTMFAIYLAFALYCRRHPGGIRHLSADYWRSVVLFYTVCGLGNLLILAKPMAPPFVFDGAGRRWNTMTVLEADALVSVFLMGSFAALAWRRLASETRLIERHDVSRVRT